MPRAAGKRDRLITLQRWGGATRNGLHELVGGTWGVLGQVWAEKVQVKDWERHQAAERTAVADVRFRFDWDPVWADLSPTDRILDEDGVTVFQISGVAEIETRTTLEVSAQARAEKEPTA